jgi:hypothetical protein
MKCATQSSEDGIPTATVDYNPPLRARMQMCTSHRMWARFALRACDAIHPHSTVPCTYLRGGLFDSHIRRRHSARLSVNTSRPLPGPLLLMGGTTQLVNLRVQLRSTNLETLL